MTNIVPEILSNEDLTRFFNKHSKYCSKHGYLSMSEFVYLIRYISFKISQNEKAMDHVNNELDKLYDDLDNLPAFKKKYFNEELIQNSNIDTHVILNLYNNLPEDKKQDINNLKPEESIVLNQNTLQSDSNFISLNLITNKDENDALTGQIEKKTTTDMKTTSNENKIDENIEISYVDQKEDKEPELAKSDIISDQPKGNFLI